MPAQRDSELLERHVTIISWPKGYSRAQASLRRIAVLHCCCAEMLVCRVDPADRRPAVQVQHVAARGGGGGAIFSAGVGGGRTREQEDRRGQKTRGTQAGRTHGRQTRTWLANCVLPLHASPALRALCPATSRPPGTSGRRRGVPVARGVDFSKKFQ